MADDRRIGIVGCGVVSSVGIGREPISEALVAGRSGIATVTSFDTAGLSSKLAAEIRDFDPHAWLEGQSLRGMSRSAHLACTAAALALADGAERRAPDPSRTALVAGTAYGNVQSMVRFDRETFQEGPRFVDAMLFPNTVINSPAGFVSIFHRLRGPNTTLSEGMSSGLAAIDYALTLLHRGVVQQALAGGFEELSQWVYLGLHNAGRLAGSRPGSVERCMPFDPDSTGFVLGEGAGFVRLAAESDDLEPLAWIAGRGDAFVPRPLGRVRAADAAEPPPDPDRLAVASQATSVREAMQRAMRQALASAAIEPDAIDAVYASASGSPRLDRLESEALAAVFGERVGVAGLPIVAVKGAVGECYGATSLVQIASALHAMRSGAFPPTLLGPSPASERTQPRRVLINAFDAIGTQRSLVLARP